MERVNLLDYDLPMPIEDDIDNIMVTLDGNVLNISVFYEGHWRGQVWLDLENRTIHDEFSHK